MSEIVCLSLGSNLGDREANLAGAITALGIYSEIQDVQSASFYETKPLYKLDQPDFLNTVVRCHTEFTPFKMLDAVINIEVLLGDQKNMKKINPE
jgi:2-amino-4-hydroxy-6-hydroxymethyldihydropteridine diphosphokinase